MIVCPKCGHENPDSATNCVQCRVNLQYALAHFEEFKDRWRGEGRGAVAPQRASAVVCYSLGHELGTTTSRFGTFKEVTTRYHTQPIEFARPEKGTRKVTVTCGQCRKPVAIDIRSPGAVATERIKRALIAVVFALIGYLAIPYSQRSGSSNTECIGWILLVIFGFIVITNGKEVFERDSRLAVAVSRNRVLDIVSPVRFADWEKHTIIYGKK